jgi:5-methyltetrahydrofolate--homocysteine methyltransferase
MNPTFLECLKTRLIILDGGMGTMLIAAGLSAGEIPERWNIDRPEVIRDIHTSYFEAGSETVITNTFGATAVKLADKSLDHETVDINRRAALIAREACPVGKFVAGDIGPTGKMAPPFGEVSINEMQEAFLQQADALIDGGVDAIIIETMFSLDEALAAVRAARQAGPSLPIIASLTYNRTPKGYYTIMGDEAAHSATVLAEAGANAVGANCTLGSADMIDLAACLRAATDLPVMIQPNAGNPGTQDGITYYSQQPEEFAADLCRIVEAGASIVGGCCGTTPEFIRAAARALGK